MTTTQEYTTQLACALKGYRALIVPDINGSDEQHWQSIWEQAVPRARRIRLQDWGTTDWVKWRNSIIASLINIDEPVVLIAQGLGALAAASVAAEYPAKIIATFLVDPANPDDYELRKKIPKNPLPVPTKIVIRNEHDTRAALLAALWGADICHVTAANETNRCEEFWPQGIRALNRLINKTQCRAEEIIQARTKKVMAYLRALKQTRNLTRPGYQPS